MNMIRFTAYDGDRLVAQTEWTPEPDRTSAVNLLSQFRKNYGGLAYRIEREGDSKVPNLRTLTRFKIQDKDDLYYSRWFEEDEVDEALGAIREKWSRADIVREVRNG